MERNEANSIIDKIQRDLEIQKSQLKLFEGVLERCNYIVEVGAYTLSTEEQGITAMYVNKLTPTQWGKEAAEANARMLRERGVNKHIRVVDKLTWYNEQIKSKEESLKILTQYVSSLNKKNHYDRLIETRPLYERIDKYFTPQMYNDLGGDNSDILKYVKSIDTHNFCDNAHVYFEFTNGASNLCSGFYLLGYDSITGYEMVEGYGGIKSDDYKYNVGFVLNNQPSIKWDNVNSDELQSSIQHYMQLNEKACLTEKKNGFQFSENEIPKGELKQAGIKIADLSAVDMNNLRQGKETGEIAIVTKGEKQVGTIRLVRKEDNSVSVSVNPGVPNRVAKGIKM